jgi:hypothetical protein
LKDKSSGKRGITASHGFSLAAPLPAVPASRFHAGDPVHMFLSASTAAVSFPRRAGRLGWSARAIDRMEERCERIDRLNDIAGK